MEKKKRRYWIPAVVILLALAVIFGGRAEKKLKAKTQLNTALSTAFSQLEERFHGDPLRILAKCYDSEGKYTAEMETVTNQDLLGTITYNMTVDTNLSAHQINASGIVKTPKQSIDLSLYLDPSFMAVSSDELAANVYYGITYDTFASDLRKIPLLDLIINDAVLSRWDDSIQEIQRQICREYSFPQIPEIGEGEIRKLLLGIAAMPCQILNTEILIGDQSLSCIELDYFISGEQVGWILSKLTGDPYEKDTSANVSFYLCKEALVRLNLSGTTGEIPFQYCFDLGLNPMQDPLTLTGSYGTSKSLSATVTTQSSENLYAESWDIHTISQGKEQDHAFSFDWNLNSGAMRLQWGQMPEPLYWNLQETEYGMRIETQDLGFWMRMLLQKEEDLVNTPKISSALTISRGSSIATPEYKNLDQWSMQDFLTLLAGAGSLMGVRLE